MHHVCSAQSPPRRRVRSRPFRRAILAILLQYSGLLVGRDTLREVSKSASLRTKGTLPSSVPCSSPALCLPRKASHLHGNSFGPHRRAILTILINPRHLAVLSDVSGSRPLALAGLQLSQFCCPALYAGADKARVSQIARPYWSRGARVLMLRGCAGRTTVSVINEAVAGHTVNQVTLGALDVSFVPQGP